MQRQHLVAQQIGVLDKALLDLYDQTGYAGFAETMAGMTSITAAMLLALSGDPADFDSGRCLAKLAGINARENESGDFKGSRGITRRGNPVLRTIAFRAAVALAKNNVDFGARPPRAPYAPSEQPSQPPRGLCRAGEQDAPHPPHDVGQQRGLRL